VSTVSELMEQHGFDPDCSEVDTLMQDQHYGASIAIGFALLGDNDDE